MRPRCDGALIGLTNRFCGLQRHRVNVNVA
jgi:hypothetical protein